MSDYLSSLIEFSYNWWKSLGDIQWWWKKFIVYIDEVMFTTVYVPDDPRMQPDLICGKVV